MRCWAGVLSVFSPFFVAAVVWINAGGCIVLQTVEVSHVTHAKRVFTRLRTSDTHRLAIFLHVLTLINALAVIVLGGLPFDTDHIFRSGGACIRIRPHVVWHMSTASICIKLRVGSVAVFLRGGRFGFVHFGVLVYVLVMIVSVMLVLVTLTCGTI